MSNVSFDISQTLTVKNEPVKRKYCITAVLEDRKLDEHDIENLSCVLCDLIGFKELHIEEVTSW